MAGTKPSGRPYIGSVLMAIVLLLLGARVAIIHPVIVTGVKTDSNGWLPIGEFSLSLFSSSLEEEFLDDGVFDLAMLDTMVQLLNSGNGSGSSYELSGFLNGRQKKQRK